jgi:homoserine acetyltransferase
MQDDLHAVARLAAVAAGVGAAARVALALHGGMRRLGLLAIEAAVGGCLGVMAAGTFAYCHPDMWDAQMSTLIVAGAAGMAGAIGTRVLDIAVLALQRKAGGA